MSRGHPNPDGALSPGLYCTVERLIPRKTPSMSDRLVPAQRPKSFFGGTPAGHSRHDAGTGARRAPSPRHRASLEFRTTYSEQISRLEQMNQRPGLHFLHHMATMNLYGYLGDIELGRDLFIHETLNDECHHFAFA